MKKHLFMVGIIMLTLNNGVYAHKADDTIIVKAKKQSLSSDNTEAAKYRLNKIAGSVQVISKKDYENSRANTIKDMSDYTAGVFSQSRINEESRLSIRGSGLSRTYHLRGLNLYQDGIPLNMADGAADFQNIDPTAFDHIEVLKGGNATVLGTSSLGGAINFVTPTGYDADKLGIRLEGGSYGMNRQGVSSGGVIGDTDYFANLSRLYSDGYRDFSVQDNIRFTSNIGRKLRDDLETRVYFTYADVNQELPGNLSKADIKKNPQKANPFYKGNNWQRDYKSYRIANKTSYFGENYQINGGVYVERKDLYHPIFQLIDQENHNYGTFLNANIDGNIGGYKNEFIIGNTLGIGDTKSQRFVNLNGNYGVKTFDQDETSKTATIYAENRFYPIDDLALIAGTQFLYSSRTAEDNFLSNGDQSGVKKYYGTSPKFGVLYNVTPDIQLFSNVSAAFEPPTFSEVSQAMIAPTGLADIKAQKSTTLEVGTRGTSDYFDWDASIYHAWLKDEIMLYDIGMGMSGAKNADKSYHQGLELSGNAKIAKDLLTSNDSINTRFAYTYSNFHFDGDSTYGDNEIPGMPKHYLRSEVRYNHPSGLSVAPNMEYVPKGYYVDMANTTKSDGYTAFGLLTSYDVTPKASVFFDARNLTDRRYAATTDVVTTINAMNGNVFTPADGRTFFAGVRAKF